jgi:hypothetical protein
MTTCIDLRDYGDRFKVWNEPEGRKAREWDDPWDLIIQGFSGFVAPYGGNFLLACTRSISTTRRVLEAVPGAEIIQDGADGQNVRFAAADFALVAQILRLRRRRQVSHEQRQLSALRLAPYRFGNGPETAAS